MTDPAALPASPSVPTEGLSALISKLEAAEAGEARFRVHPGQLSSRSRTTFWVRDRLDPKWPDGPYQTREAAEDVLAILKARVAAPLDDLSAGEVG